jgi:hypothetical protein
MTTHRYHLEPYKTIQSRHTCPECGARKKFTRYIDAETRTHLAPHVGKCDREESCGYHYTPKQYFEATGQNRTFSGTPAYLRKPAPVAPPPSTIPQHLFTQSLKGYEHNHLVQFLHTLFDDDTVNQLVNAYHIGTSKHWPGATVFWQVDGKQKVRTGKIMLYDGYTGKRIKHPYPHITWAHVLVGNGQYSVSSNQTAHCPPVTANYNLKQCLFGEHLLNQYPHKVVAIVESEKTALIAAGFMPEYLWLAAGSLEGLSYQKCRVLKGRNIMLYPDIDGFRKWQDKMLELNRRLPEANFNLSHYLQQNVPRNHHTTGMDIADYFIQDLYAQHEFEREWGLRDD